MSFAALALSKEAEAQLTRWPARARKLLTELLDDAATALQRELLQRSVAAGHSPNEVHAFADQLRGMADEDAFAACTLDQDAPIDYTVTQLLRAESDPLFAFELKGGRLEPADDEVPLVAVKPKATEATLRRNTASFVADSSDVAPTLRTASSTSHLALSPMLAAGQAAPSSMLFSGILDDATRAHGITWHESEVDVEGGPGLESALAAAATFVGDGVPVPMALGNAPGRSGRLILALQLAPAGRSRAWQLYDPFSNELVWANEGDLLARLELPFSNKFHRRITRIALPSRRRTAF